MSIPLPSIEDQHRHNFLLATTEAIEKLQKNLDAPVIKGPAVEVATNEHLLREFEGWVAPPADLVYAYFKHFQQQFPKYGTDKALARLLGLSSDRRVREYKAGARTVPYGIWRKFLVITGRVPQDIIEVLAFMG